MDEQEEIKEAINFRITGKYKKIEAIRKEIILRANLIAEAKKDIDMLKRLRDNPDDSDRCY